MKNKIFLLALLGLSLVGCASKEENLGQNPSKEELGAAQARKDEVMAIYKRAGGNWDAMTPEDKKRLLELSNNDEAMAKQGWPMLGKM